MNTSKSSNEMLVEPLYRGGRDMTSVRANKEGIGDVLEPLPQIMAINGSSSARVEFTVEEMKP